MKKQPIVIYMPPDLRTTLDAVAEKEGRSRSATIVNAFKEHVYRQELSNATLKKMGVKL